MDLELRDSPGEIKRLQGCIKDLVSLLALPAVWSGREPHEIVETLLDALLRMLCLDLVYARVKDADTPLEVIRVAHSFDLKPHEIHEMLSDWFEGDGQKLPPPTRNRVRDKDISIFPVPLGVHGETGMILLGTNRADFPGQTESLLLSVAASQASIGLKEAWLLTEQKRTASQLERQIAERTEGLAATNEELRKEIADRKKIEERLLESDADRRQAEEALRASELDARSLLDNMPGFLARLSPDGTPEIFNRPFLQYLGKTVEEIRKWRTSDIVHRDDLAHTIEGFANAISRGQPFDFEYRLRRFDGVYLWFQARGVPVRNVEGRILHWNALITDIDDRKKAEEALQSSQRNLSLTINAIPALIHSARPDGYIDFLNKGWLDFVGLPLEEVVGWGWTKTFHPEDVDQCVANWRAALASGEPFEVEGRARRADGEYRTLLHRKVPLRNEHGNIVRWYGISFDIEDRKRAEAQVEQAYLRLAEAQRLSKTGSFITDLLADDHDWSEEAFRVFEFDPSTKVTVQRIRDIIHPEDLPTFDAVIARAIMGTDVDFVFRIVPPGRGVKHVRGLARLMAKIGSRPLFIGAIQDVTESKVAEEALDRARSELAHVARITTLNALTASIAHEINQPLSGIITNASTCLRMLNGDPPNVDGARETARRTIRDGNRASDVITRLRALFTKKELTLEPLDLNEATREVIALSLSDLQRNRVILRSELAEDLPPVIGDRVQLQQVTLNLLRNASDAMVGVDDRPRQLLIRTRREAEDRVRLSVQDTGTGVNPQDLERFFEAFYTTKGGGMGIGLSVSRSIIERHHGRLWAEPNDGPGATFSFSIPCRPESATGAAA
jgi:PAS domain S-box-containing protein